MIQGLRIDRQALNIVLSGLRWALGTNPTVYPKVPDTKSLYVAKTSRRKCPTGEVPMLRIFYAINEDGSVELLSIETMDLFL